MASNYNKVPRPAVVFVRDGGARLVVRRETADDLVRLDEPCSESTSIMRRCERVPSGSGCSGCGNVGAALVRLVDEHADVVEQRAGVAIEIARVAVRDLVEARAT